MKQFKSIVSKLSLQGAGKSKAVAGNVDDLSTVEKNTPVWTTGQEFQFYVPWLWKESPEPPPDRLQTSRQVVWIPRPTLSEPSGLTGEFQEAWIRQHVTNAVGELVHDGERYPTCTDRQLREWHHDQVEAWEHFNIVQSKCDLPQVSVSGYDGVLPVKITMVIKKVSICGNESSSTSSRLEWKILPSPGNCIERIENQVRIHLTPECSIHVHIRPPAMHDFDLQSFKKMASLLWLAEVRLDKLYHPARSSFDFPPHRSLRKDSNLALDVDPLFTDQLGEHTAVLDPLTLDDDDKKKLATIWQVPDHHELRGLLRVHPRVGKHDVSAYNFFNLFMASDKQTIEFRKMESTTDAQVVDAWIEVFLLLTDFCMTCSTETFQGVMQDLVKPDDGYSTWNLLRDIGCTNLTIDVLTQKFFQQWSPLPPTSRPGSSTASTAGTATGTSTSRFRDCIRDGTKKLAGEIARGYSYGN